MAIARPSLSNSPFFWLWLVLGSVGLHLLLLLVVLPLSVRFTTSAAADQSADLEPVPIEMVELTPEETSTAVEVPQETASAAPEQAPEQPPIAAPTPVPDIAPVEDSVETITIPIPQIPSPPEASPSPTPIPSPTITPTLSPTPTPAPTSLPSPQSPTPLPAPVPTPSPSNPIPGNLTPLEPPPESGGGSDNLPPTDGSEDLTENLPGIGINASPEPVRLTASITELQYREDTGEFVDYPFDLYDTNAYPLEMASPAIPVDPMAGNACILNPESQRFLGTAVALRILVEADGSISQTFVAEHTSPESTTPQVSEAYLELAQCLVRSLPFQPATQEGSPVASDNLIVHITIAAE